MAKLGTFGRSGFIRKTNDSLRLIMITFAGFLIGFFIGISFPSVNITKLHFPSSIASYNEDKNSGIKTQALLNHAWLSTHQNNSLLNSTNTAKIYVSTNPKGAESLAPEIIVPESDLYLRRLWGNPSEKLLLAGGSATPKSMHEVIAHLACRISEWDDRVFRISNFVAADEIELKFPNRRSDEDLTSLNMILHEEIKNLRTQVIGVKWALHAREVIVFELLQYLGKTPTKCLLERIITNTRKMLEELEAVRGRLFNIEHFLQSTVNTKLQDQSLRITHYMTVFGGPMLLISLVVSIFGVNLDGIPGTMKSPYAFSLFCGILILVGIAFVLLCMHYFRLKNDTTKEEVNARRLEHQQLISMYRRDLETQAKIR